MQFEVINRREEREGFIFKKPVYLAQTNIHLNDDEFEALQSMAKSKEWSAYPLGERQISPKFRQKFTLVACYGLAAKTKVAKMNIRASLPEERELQISEARDIATNLKQVLEARLSALNASDEDVLEEI